MRGRGELVKKLLVVAAVAGTLFGGFTGIAPEANAEVRAVVPYKSGEWHGPFPNKFVCAAVWSALPTFANFNECERHDDGKWWFYEP